MSIQRHHLLNPITALEFHHSKTGALLILAGEGSFLKIFDPKGSGLLRQCEIFHGQAIHGIAVRNGSGPEVGLRVVIWGASSLALLTSRTFDLILTQDVSSIADTAISVSDWILDVAIAPFDHVGCVLVTAHNTVIQARLAQSGHAPLLETLHSPSRSILYSAHIIWESPSCVMIAAGTVFGEILVWQCSPSDETASVASRVLFTFKGHEGSIFGVNISPPVVGLGNNTRLLASCSDDRTIRVWNMTIGSNSSHPTAPAVLARETGFGENGIGPDSAKTETSQMAMAMGHASRIWRVRFLGEQSSPLMSSAINILSFGEDSTTQQWGLDIETMSQGTLIRSNLSASLNHLHTFTFHSGKHIWSTALHQMDNSEATLATGGADGKISLFNFSTSGYVTDIYSPPLNNTESPTFGTHITPNKLPWSSSWELDKVLNGSGSKNLIQSPSSHQPSSKSSHEDSPEVSDGVLLKNTKAKKLPRDAFNRYAFISEKEVLVTTTFGRVFLCCIDSVVHWDEIILHGLGPEDLKSYAVVVGFPEIGLACLAGANGRVYVYQLRQSLLLSGRVEGKVADLFKIYDPQTKSFELLVTTLGGTAATLFSFDLSGSSMRLVENAVCNLPERFVVTSAGRNNNMLILGSRSGSLALYMTTKPEKPLQMWTPPDDILRDAITTITSLPTPNESRDSASEYFLTTGRDGFYSIFSTTILWDPNMAVVKVVVQRVHQGNPPFGPMVEAGWFEGKNLVLYGFKGKNFVVWNETEQCEITNVECGGSHRSYAYSPGRGSTGGYFVYTKASKMYLHSHQPSSHRVIKPGGHGREIKACAVSEGQNLIATGAEDTAILIWRYNNRATLESPLDCQTIIQKHSTGIQHLQWHKSSYLFSSGGNEEFFVWAIEHVPDFGIGVICEATCPDPSEHRDLRIMSFDVTEMANYSGSPSETYLLISLAYSDSTIRTYTYSKRDLFHLVATGRYTSACLTQIRHIRLQDDEIISLTAATDGRLTLWKGSFDTDPRNGVQEPVQMVVLSTQTIHQSAIKCLDMTRLENHVLVATGGDDNALGISIYPVAGSMAAVVPTCSILRSSHAAAITGLCFVRECKAENSDGSFKVVSSGNDQKVKSWVVRVEIGGPADEGDFSLDVKQAGDTFTPVADIGDVAAFGAGNNLGKVLVVGNGMEVWEIPGHRRKGFGLPFYKSNPTEKLPGR